MTQRGLGHYRISSEKRERKKRNTDSDFLKPSSTEALIMMRSEPNFLLAQRHLKEVLRGFFLYLDILELLLVCIWDQFANVDGWIEEECDWHASGFIMVQRDY